MPRLKFLVLDVSFAFSTAWGIRGRGSVTSPDPTKKDIFGRKVSICTFRKTGEERQHIIEYMLYHDKDQWSFRKRRK